METQKPTAIFFPVALCLGIFVFILSYEGTAFGLSKKDVLQPLKNELTLYQSALKDLERRVQLQFSNFSTEKNFLKKNIKDIEKNSKVFLDANEVSKEIEDAAVLTGWQLINELDDNISIPGYGQITMQELLDEREKHAEERKTRTSAIESGIKDFFIPGLGMTNKNTLQKRITTIEEAQKTLETNVAEGTVRIYFPGLGNVSKKELETSIALQKEKINTVSKQIKEGEYVVSIPGVGDVSRNTLQARIDALKKQIDTLGKNFKAGGVRINRAPEGWLTEKDITESTALLKNKSTVFTKNFKTNNYKHLLPIGWVSPKELDTRITQLKKEMKEIKTQVSKQTYKIALADGTWATEKDIDKALMNSLLSSDVRNALLKGKKDVAVTSNYEIKKRDIEIKKLTRWKKELKELASPLLDAYKQQLQRNAVLKKEFAMEKKSALGPLQQRLYFLQKSLKVIP